MTARGMMVAACLLALTAPLLQAQEAAAPIDFKLSGEVDSDVTAASARDSSVWNALAPFQGMTADGVQTCSSSLHLE